MKSLCGIETISYMKFVSIPYNDFIYEIFIYEMLCEIFVWENTEHRMRLIGTSILLRIFWRHLLSKLMHLTGYMQRLRQWKSKSESLYLRQVRDLKTLKKHAFRD